ncbi:hypothetical protein EYV94_22875 [Puteibacter caeruleilacunae]|nr:hypothetical protein EYV94_22875 [Puteibacter caeruleilacunae]
MRFILILGTLLLLSNCKTKYFYGDVYRHFSPIADTKYSEKFYGDYCYLFLFDNAEYISFTETNSKFETGSYSLVGDTIDFVFDANKTQALIDSMRKVLNYKYFSCQNKVLNHGILKNKYIELYSVFYYLNDSSKFKRVMEQSTTTDFPPM